MGSYLHYVWFGDSPIACYTQLANRINPSSTNFSVPNDSVSDYKEIYVCYYSSGGGVQESTRVSNVFKRDNAGPEDVDVFISPGATIAQNSTVVCDWDRSKV